MYIKLPITLALFHLLLSSGAQTPIRGTVRDGARDPIAGATVLLKGTSTHTVTGADGTFTLTVAATIPYTVIVSSVGYKSEEIDIYEVPEDPLAITLREDNLLSEVVVTARRRTETAQQVPIPISIVGGSAVENAGAFNVNRVKELVPTVQLYSSNPRNTTLNIRGMGSTFGLTNDGIDPGVGFYVDGVYYARPAATTLDFVDIEQIEVLRGPQGTLFGKNTTAGAFNVKTRKPSFTPGLNLEVSYGNYGFIQAKSSVTGPLGEKIAARVSFSGTQRDGVIHNISTNQPVNDLNNLGLRAQILYTPNSWLDVNVAADMNRQRPDGYAQVIAGVAPTLRPAYRQFGQIISDLNYQLPSTNPFDRVVDHNTSWRSGNDLGGISLNVDAKAGRGTLTSTTAWRYWKWDPSNDRDFTALPVLTLSQATSGHEQWTQEIRYSGDLTNGLSAVAGVFAISQDLKTDPYHIEESGAAQWRFSQNSTSDRWKTPGLLEGYGIRTTSRLQTFGAAAFVQLDWAVGKALHILPGVRYNHDEKKVGFDRRTYGGLDTSDPELIALKRAVYTDQAFTADVDESNFSGQFTVSYRPRKTLNGFATLSTSYKPVGVNLGGLPTANGEVLTDLARIKPEYVTHFEFGVKSSPSPESTFNITFYNTEVEDYQTQVQTAEVGVNRGYLANAEEVRVQGVEVDGNIRVGRLTLNGALAYTDGRYVSFTNAPVPLEETGAASAFKDISGSVLPGISKWAGSAGGELTGRDRTWLNQSGTLFVGVDLYYRSDFSSSPSPSRYLNVDGYALVNARAGFRATQGLSLFAWIRNASGKDYFEQLLPAAGNAGHYAAVLGDPRTYGITIRYSH